MYPGAVNLDDEGCSDSVLCQLQLFYHQEENGANSFKKYKYINM